VDRVVVMAAKRLRPCSYQPWS